MGKWMAGYTVKEKIFLYYMLFFILISALTIIGNIASGLAFSYNYKWGATLVTSGLFFRLSLDKKKAVYVRRAGIYLFCFLMLPMCWLSSSGLMSPSITYSFLLLILINTMTRGIERICINTAFILVNMAMVALYTTHPGVFSAMTHAQQFVDWIVNLPIVFSFAALLLATVEKAYETEQQKNISINKKLKDLSGTDGLTGLYNRTHLAEYAPRVLAAHRRSGRSLSLLMLDIDHFKDYNDTYGHLEGDQCLKTVSTILKNNSSRPTDFAYRYGGEEFLLLLGDTGPRGARVVAEKIQQDLKAAALPHKGCEWQHVSVSIGICVSRNAKGLDQLLTDADQALYKSKDKGRNCISLWPQGC